MHEVLEDSNQYTCQAIPPAPREPGIMRELAMVTRYLEEFKREIARTEKSPRFLILDHCIQACNAYLETLIRQERHLEIARNARRYAESLKTELQGYLGMLDPPPELPAEPARMDNIARQPEPNNESPSEGGSGAENASLLKIHTFGEFRMFLGNQKIECSPKGKCKQLFKYLVIHHKKPTPREQLMELFWPGHDEPSGRNNLNVAIYALRQSLKKSFPDMSTILFRDGCYQINPDIPLWVDANEMEDCLRDALKHESRHETEAMLEKLQRAEELYTGRFLDEDAYADWVIEKQLQLQEDYLLVLEKLNKVYLDRGAHHRCIDVNKKILAIDICNEKAHQRLMESYVVLGQRHLALKQFGICKEALRRELDLPPQASLTQLFDDIRNANTDVCTPRDQESPIQGARLFADSCVAKT